MKNKIAERLSEAINRSGLSYREIAELSKVPKSAVQRYANGETEKIPVERLKAIAAAIGENSAYIMGWNVPSQQTMNTISEMLGVHKDAMEESANSDISEEAHDFALAFDALSDDHKRLARGFMALLQQAEQK